MAQVAAAVGADDLRAAPVGVGFAAHGAFDFVVEAGPSAARVKFVFGAVQGRLALPAHVNAGRFVVPIFSGKGAFGAFVEYYAGFFRCEWIAFGHDVVGCRLSVVRSLFIYFTDLTDN